MVSLIDGAGERFHCSTSKGYQIKWFSNGHYIKLDSLGYESVAESLVSRLLLFLQFSSGRVYTLHQGKDIRG